MKRLLLDNIKKTGTIFAIFGMVAGTISDILQPLFPFVSYIFFATTFSSILLLLTLVLLKSLQTKIVPSFLFSFSIMIFSGIFYIIQTTQTEDSGFLAEKIPVVSNLQSYIGIIQDDISTIKTTTENIDEKTDKIITSLEDIQKNFSAITESNGIIENPIRPEQFYHNARIQELGGDYTNARKSYNSYFAFKLDFIDPHLRYQTFLKIQEGRAGAREIYSYLYDNDPRPIVEYARILLFDAPLRTNMLEGFIESNPDFVPAYYELSREFSEDRKGLQTLTDKRSELKALQEFSLLKDRFGLLKYFVDKELAAKWIKKSEILILKLNQNSNLLMPVSATVSYYSKQRKRLFCCDPMYVSQEDSNATCTGKYKNDWKQISEGQMCFRETKEEIYFTYFWEISVQIDEQSSDPVISLASKTKGDKSNNNKTKKILVYCQNKDTKTLLWERENNCRSYEVQISQTKFNQLTQSKTIVSSTGKKDEIFNNSQQDDVPSQSVKILKIERLKELNNSTEFISNVYGGKYGKANDLDGSIIFVSYTDSRGNQQGPYEIILNK